jgi:hypothetical protein
VQVGDNWYLVIIGPWPVAPINSSNGTYMHQIRLYKSKVVNNKNIALVQSQSKMKTWLHNVNRFKTHIYSLFLYHLTNLLVLLVKDQLSPSTNYRQLARYSRAHANFLAIFCRRQ